MKIILIKTTAIALAGIFLSACSTNKHAITNHSNAFAKGADISWLPQMEATGFKFRNAQGMKEDCFKNTERQRYKHHQVTHLGKPV